MHFTVSLPVLCRDSGWKLDRTHGQRHPTPGIFLFGKKSIRSSWIMLLNILLSQAVHFALCHIYSGASHPPEGISLMEFASLSDLLGLEGLKEVTAYALKINYCHNFHKVCRSIQSIGNR